MTASNGTDLTAKIEGGPTKLYTGIISDESIEMGVPYMEFPAGVLMIGPDEKSADGKFVSDVSTPLFGNSVQNVTWNFEGY